MVLCLYYGKNIHYPVYKAGNISDVQNYKPIAIIGTVSKIFYSIAAKHLTTSVSCLLQKMSIGS